MKAFLILSLVLLTSCGGGGGGGAGSGGDQATTSCGFSGDIVGTWDNITINDRVIISNTCTYTSTYCEGNGTILPYEYNGKSNYVIIQPTKNNGLSSCVKAGTGLVCAYSLSSNKKTLTLDCGSTLNIYTKQ